MMIIQFADPVDGFTHGSVNSQTRVEAAMVRLDMTYGTMDGEDFIPSQFSGQITINGADMIDLIEQVKKAPGRPADKPDYEYEFDDVREWLESPKAEREARIQARAEALEAESV